LWQLSLSSSLGGLESRLPEPFDKARARAVPVKADLIVSSEVQDFVVESGRGNQIRGQVLAGVTSAHFDVQGISGELRRSSAKRTNRICGLTSCRWNARRRCWRWRQRCCRPRAKWY
jgi:hypothetical protein